MPLFRKPAVHHSCNGKIKPAIDSANATSAQALMSMLSQRLIQWSATGHNFGTRFDNLSRMLHTRVGRLGVAGWQACGAGHCSTGSGWAVPSWRLHVGFQCLLPVTAAAPSPLLRKHSSIIKRVGLERILVCVHCWQPLSSTACWPHAGFR